MKQIEFLILMTLAEGPAHGYGMVTAIRDFSGGAVSLEPGNLYRRLRALEDLGLVAPADAPDSGDGDHEERRRYYRLTEDGRGGFLDETRRLAQLAASAGAVAARVAR